MKTSFGAGVLILSALALAPQGSAKQIKEPAHMQSDTSQSETGSPVSDLLATYDHTHDPARLQAATDQLAMSLPADAGGVAPAPSATREKLGLWLAVLSRFHRDLDPGFDPAQPPSLTVAPPKVGGAQMPPGVRPSDLKDPEARADYEAAIARNAQRVEQFKAQAKLHSLHEAALEDATAFLKGAEQPSGLPAHEIEAALSAATLLPADRKTLTEATLPK